MLVTEPHSEVFEFVTLIWNVIRSVVINKHRPVEVFIYRRVHKRVVYCSE